MALKSYPKRIHRVDEVRAKSSTGGVKITDDAGTVGLFVEDVTGHVGIGTTSPTSNLEIEGSSGDLVIEIDNNAVNSANFQIQNGAGNARVDLVVDSDTHLTLKNQRVGIVQNDPAYTLDVNGNGQITTDLLIGGTATATAFAGDGSALTGLSSSAARFAVSEKVYVSTGYNSKVYFGAYTNNTYAYRFTQTYTGSIPAAGADLTVSSGAYYGPRSMTSAVAPVACKLIGLAYTLNFYDPDNLSESLRIGVVKSTFAQGSDGSETDPTSDGTWTGLGYTTTYAMTGNPPAQLQKGTATFAADNTVGAGDGVGILFQSIGQGGAADSANVGNFYGVITLYFEAT